MHGDCWIPCAVIYRNEALGEITIRYYDDFLGDVEASVDAERVRET